MSNLFLMPPTTVTGANALENSAGRIAALGRKALIVSGKVMEKIGNVKRLEEVLSSVGVEYAVFTDITGEPTDTMIDAGVKAYLENGCDFLIGIGGGSPLDSMKAIAAMITNPGKISDYMGKVISNPVPPMVAIPTTAGTGSETTQFTIITDTENNVKMLLKGPVLMPNLAIIDSALTISAGKNVTAATGLDALTHAVESYTSRKAHPLTNTLALSAVCRIFKYLPVCYADGTNLEAREQMAIASFEAGCAFNNASVTIVHGMSRPIGALFHVPHGISNAMLLKECLAFALDGAYQRFGELGKAIGVAEEKDSDRIAAEKFLGAIENICNVCEIPTLEKYGIDRVDFFRVIDKMASDAIASGSPGNTIKEVSVEDVKAIYRKLWE